MIDAKDPLSATTIDAFIAECVQEPDAVRAHRKQAKENHVPVVSKTIGNFLQLLVRLHHPHRILEIGTGYGLSTRLMLDAGTADLTIDTIEIDATRFAVSGAWLRRDESRIHRILADVRNEATFKNLSGPYDIIFIDAAKGQYEKLLDRCLPILHHDGCIVLADVFINGWVITGHYPNHRRKTAVLRMQKFLQNLHHDTRFHLHLFGIDDGVVVLTQRK